MSFALPVLRLKCAWALRGSALPESYFLVASHIKPWKDANPNERLDGFNGLPLTPNLDRAFDRGYVSFAEVGSIMIFPVMSVESMQALGIRPDMALRLCDERIGAYMAYHRDFLFREGRPRTALGLLSLGQLFLLRRDLLIVIGPARLISDGHARAPRETTSNHHRWHLTAIPSLQGAAARPVPFAGLSDLLFFG